MAGLTETPGGISERSYQNKDSRVAERTENTYFLRNFTEATLICIFFDHPM